MTHFQLRTVTCLVIACALGVASAPWKFGLIGDTQWGSNVSGGNPNSVAVGIINQVNKEFVTHGVKFVVAVGDITDNGSTAAIDTRATFAQELYNNGIGFYPLRGNHESSATAAAEFKRVFPQTQTGANNNTPTNAFVYTDSANTHPVAKTGATFSCGSGFTSPHVNLTGLSYEFRYENATCIILDQFTPPTGSTISIPSQQSWISSVLSGRPANSHGFVLGHKGIITENHADNLFGNNPASDSAGTNTFIKSLADNNVHLYIGGHDHLYNRSLVTTTDGLAVRVQDIILASNSYKFYEPDNPSIDDQFNVPAFGRKRQIQIAQDLYQIGYTIVTVDGPRVTVEYYGVLANQTGADLTSTPALTGKWKLRNRFGYSLNGKEFVVAQGQSFSSVADTFGTTRARILFGTNTDNTKDASNRAVQRLVATGWVAKNGTLCSDELTLWGMTGIGTQTTSQYLLSLSYETTSGTAALQQKLGLLSKAANGQWITAVDNNTGGVKSFVIGATTQNAALGTHGIDTLTKTVWAVVNCEGEFAAGPLPASTKNKRSAHVGSLKDNNFAMHGKVLEFPVEFKGKPVTTEFYTYSGKLLHKIKSMSDKIEITSLLKKTESGMVLVRAKCGPIARSCRVEILPN